MSMAVFNKSLFIKAGGGLDLAPELQFANACSKSQMILAGKDPW